MAVGFEAYDKTEKKYQEDVIRLTMIALGVVDNRDLASFVRAFAQTWMEADPSNQRILREAWAAIVVKYSLVKYSLEEGGR